MTYTDDGLVFFASIAMVGGMSGLAYQLAKRPALERPRLGGRGMERMRALRLRGAFAHVEPAVRYVASFVSVAPLRALRPRLTRLLTQSGDYLGLSEEELVATSFLCGLGGCAATWMIGDWLDLSSAAPAAGFLVGTLLPPLKLAHRAKNRLRRITRSLPGVIELAALCMGAGLDFPGSLRRIVSAAADPDEPIVQELKRVLQELDLGRTRREAMEGFLRRAPSDEVRELVHSVVQAEERGNPLSQILAIQAQTLRLRRSIAAEETASEAALMLVGPMTLMFLCVIVLLLGPVGIRVMAGGLHP